jgi:hypothetical protein
MTILKKNKSTTGVENSLNIKKKKTRKTLFQITVFFVWVYNVFLHLFVFFYGVEKP